MWTRLGFRTQLVVIIAATFIVGGALLLVAQYLVLSRSLVQEVGTYSFSIAGDPGRAGVIVGDADVVPGALPDGASVTTLGSGQARVANPLVNSVLGTVQVWSGLLLLVFAGLAVFGAWWVSRRTALRIAAVTTAANAITERDLSKRLDLPGPDDEIKQLGQAIDKMIGRLDEAFTRQESFIANASHEFRTPLATARTALQVAIRQGRVSDELLPEVEDVLAANRRLERLVGALLTVAQGRADVDLARTPVDLGALVAQVVSEENADGTSVSVRFGPPPAPVTVVGSEPLLHSMVANLVANAVRHNIPGGEVTVEVTAGGGAGVTVTVANTGPVIPADAVRHLTEPFHRGERSRQRNADGSEAGLGLGLALVDSIVRVHDGHLSLSPRDGGGLIAVVTLPSAGLVPRAPLTTPTTPGD
jgi:signal transduction histidine kinase